MSKGILTKEIILKAAFDFSSVFGLEALTIGKLADKVGLSKSGLFGHFQSKEKLQIMVLEYIAAHYTNQVLRPALTKSRGIPRLRAVIENWSKWTDVTVKGGCPLLAAAIEFDDRPGEVQEKVQELLTSMIRFFEKSAVIAIEEGHFSSTVNPKHFAFEFYSLMTAHHIYSRLLKQKNAKQFLMLSFDNLLERSAQKTNS